MLERGFEKILEKYLLLYIFSDFILIVKLFNINSMYK